MKTKHALALGITSSLFSICSSAAELTKVTADIWVDNWFALYHGDQLIKEDSVPYHTERSFNSESFSFEIDLPAQLSVIMKDFKEDDTGLEYIGERGQQMGDGGFAAQFFNDNGDLIGASSSDGWRCLTIHFAPVNKSCARSSNPQSSCESIISPEPANWKAPDFDDSGWSAPIEYSYRSVRPHGGFSSISWESEAKLIWGGDLEQDNTILCRFTLTEEDL